MAGDPTVNRKFCEELIEAHVSTEVENNRSSNIASQDTETKDDALIQIDPLFTSIEEKLKGLPSKSTEHCIYRVFPRLRNIKPEAYTPQVVSIGPFHHGEERLQQAMEVYKMRHLQLFLVRTGNSLQNILTMVRGWEERARNCYAETFDKLSRDEFVEMILMDGCFIVELLLSVEQEHLTLSSEQMVEEVMKDMLLLENQLPFFVLDGFYNLVPDKSNYSSFLMLVLKSFKNGMNLSELPPEFSSSHEIKHFVDIIYHCYLSSFRRVVLQPDAQHEGNALYERPPSVTELHRAGIKFEKGSDISLFDIKFSTTNGILKIPQLLIEDSTDSWFRNIIAFEQCQGPNYRIISDYFMLLDDLINTSQDVDLLIHAKIITSMLGSSEEVATLFNDSGKEVAVSLPFSFHSLCQELNAYCGSPLHKWKATLRRDYFNSPWTTISVISAVFLLVLTFIQAYCSIISL